MDRVVPAETDTLCESCGYTLNGLPPGANCPECGTPVERSTSGDGRGLTGFEQRPGGSSFFATTVAVLLRTRRFYRAIETRIEHPAAAIFAQRHRAIAAVLFALAALGHAMWVDAQAVRRQWLRDSLAAPLLLVVLMIVVYALMTWTTQLAAWLSAIEGRFWGMRLPRHAVARCLQYHTASYLPVGVLAVTVVWGYRWMLQTGRASWASGNWYLGTLSAAVVLSAGYLFRQYVVAMRGIRYANR